ncbi:Retrovirus-related Pol polyprotein [Arachis hypogaea]|nr:Retrovirus-related Pol polyprotein [Arachis hypogaea]
MSQSTYDHPLALLISDVWGPALVISKNGFQFYISFIDVYARHTSIYLLTHKSQVFAVLKQYKSFMGRQTGFSIKSFQSDNEGEYRSTAFKDFLKQEDIAHRLSCPHTPQQNGLAERKHRHIIETGLALLATASLPLLFWDEAFSTVYLINRMPSPNTSHLSSHELLFNQIPDYSSLKIFGCLCYPNLRPYTSHKLEYRSQPCIFLGYAINHRGYKCLSKVKFMCLVMLFLMKLNSLAFPSFPLILINLAPLVIIFMNFFLLFLLSHLLPLPLLISIPSINSYTNSEHLNSPHQASDFGPSTISKFCIIL